METYGLPIPFYWCSTTTNWITLNIRFDNWFFFCSKWLNPQWSRDKEEACMEQRKLWTLNSKYMDNLCTLWWLYVLSYIIESWFHTHIVVIVIIIIMMTWWTKEKYTTIEPVFGPIGILDPGWYFFFWFFLLSIFFSLFFWLSDALLLFTTNNTHSHK